MLYKIFPHLDTNIIFLVQYLLTKGRMLISDKTEKLTEKAYPRIQIAPNTSVSTRIANNTAKASLLGLMVANTLVSSRMAI